MWCTRYRPKDLESLTLHQDVTKVLVQLSRCKNLPHLIFCGKSGSGRHTRALALLKDVYGVKNITTIQSSLSYVVNGEQKELPCVKSNVHVELNASLAGVQDAAVVQSAIREAAQTKSVNSAFRVIFLQEADRLTFQAQQALRRLLEEHAKQCRIFFFCQDASPLLAPLKSRCFVIRLPTVKKSEMLEIGKEVLEKVYQTSYHNKSGVTEAQMQKLADLSGGNLRRFLLLIQSLDVSLKASTSIRDVEVEVLPEWKQKLLKFMQTYLGEGTGSGSHAISEEFRTSLIDIIKKGVPYDVLLNEFVGYIVGEVKSPKVLLTIFNQACEYSYRLQNSLYGLIHLEAFLLTAIHYIRATG